ncbi:MAG: GAF domain-containing protein [Myxococcales bacterium]|nr:GAF domain-containing protein [Myxococcales bacterium]
MPPWTNTPLQRWLTQFLADHGASAGTVHVAKQGDLHLAAAIAIPPPVIAAVRHVPHGRGMAGAAQLAKAPVQTCNLKDDKSGNVRPGAKAVDAKAAIAIPVLGPDGDVQAVVGAAWHTDGAVPAEREANMVRDCAGCPVDQAQ